MPDAKSSRPERVAPEAAESFGGDVHMIPRAAPAPLETLPRDEWGLPARDIYSAYLEGLAYGRAEGREEGREEGRAEVLDGIDRDMREAARVSREWISVHNARQRAGVGP